MTPTDIRDALEAMHAVTDADESGVYALEIAVPNAVDAVQRQWLITIDAALPEPYADQLASAERCLYVGATSRPIRERLAEHARGDVRRASCIRAFDIVAVAGVWPGAHSGVAERDRARALSDASTAVWCDGEVF